MSKGLASARALLPVSRVLFHEGILCKLFVVSDQSNVAAWTRPDGLIEVSHLPTEVLVSAGVGCAHDFLKSIIVIEQPSL